MNSKRKAHLLKTAKVYKKLFPFSVVLFAISIALALWNFQAIRDDIAPDHLLPFVKILSGTEQCVPIAYQWTAYFTAISILSTSISGGALLGFSIVLLWNRFIT